MADIIDLSSFRSKFGKYISIALVLVIIIAILILNPFVQVDRGERKVIFNRYTGEVRSLPPGTHIVMPLVYSQEAYPTVTQNYSRTSKASTQDLQGITIETTLNYSLNPDLVGRLHEEIGPEYKTLIIRPTMEESIKAATARFKIQDIIKERPKLKSIIEKNMALNTKKIILAKTTLLRKGKKKQKAVMVKIPVFDKKTGKRTGYKEEKLDIDNPVHVKYAVVPSYFVIENVNIQSVRFSKEYENEVEKKEIQKQKNETAKQYEQETKFKKAAQKNIADAEAYAQKVLAKTASKESIRLKWIEKWDGKLPQTIMGGNTKALLNLPTK